MAIAHGKGHEENTFSASMNQCLHDLANLFPDVVSHSVIDGAYEQSVPVALNVINRNVATLLRDQAQKEGILDDKKRTYIDTAEYIEVVHSFWRACDETGMERQTRCRLLKDVKRYFLRGIEDWRTVPPL